MLASRNLVLLALIAAALTVERSAAFVAPEASAFSALKSSSPSPIKSTFSNDAVFAGRASSSRRDYSLYSAVADEVNTVQAPSCDENDPDCITKPRGATNDWEVHKFGGASLATADLYRTVGDLLIREAQGRGEGSVPTMA